MNGRRTGFIRRTFWHLALGPTSVWARGMRSTILCYSSPCSRLWSISSGIEPTAAMKSRTFPQSFPRTIAGFFFRRDVADSRRYSDGNALVYFDSFVRMGCRVLGVQLSWQKKKTVKFVLVDYLLGDKYSGCLIVGGAIIVIGFSFVSFYLSSNYSNE